jgi:hypothetical protein
MNISLQVQLAILNAAQRGAPLAANMVPRARSTDLDLDLDLALEPMAGDVPTSADAVLFKAILDGGDDDASPASSEQPESDAESGPDLPSVAMLTRRAEREGRQEGQGHDASCSTHEPDPKGVPDVRALGDMVVRVCVESQQTGGRGIRMTMDDEVLPATQLSVFERDGRLAVVFVSTSDETRGRLRHSANPMAHRIATELTRDVLLKVAAHDQDDRSALEVRVDAPAPTAAADVQGGRT